MAGSLWDLLVCMQCSRYLMAISRSPAPCLSLWIDLTSAGISLVGLRPGFSIQTATVRAGSTSISWYENL